jgi:hypothetical protein
MSDQFTTERDSYGRLLADREVWRQAGTLAAAGELTARWLEGTSEYQPGTLAPRFDDETLPIAGQLAELNRSGLFTKESQPGFGPDAGLAQREYVTGFCSADVGCAPAASVCRDGIHCHRPRPREVSQASVPVTLHDGEVATVLGSSENPVESEQIQDWARESNETLALVLADSWYVELLDPVWGRQQHLLPAVLESLKSAPEDL